MQQTPEDFNGRGGRRWPVPQDLMRGLSLQFLTRDDASILSCFLSWHHHSDIEVEEVVALFPPLGPSCPYTQISGQTQNN